MPKNCVSGDRLKDQSGGLSSENPKAYITAPPVAAEVMTCKVVDGLSSLIVSGSEELVSSVIRIEITNHNECPFPLTVAVPFQASCRGNHREITVKVVDLEQRVSYVTPTSTDCVYGGQRVCNEIKLYFGTSFLFFCCYCYKSLELHFCNILSCITLIFSSVMILSTGFICSSACVLAGSVCSSVRTESFTVPKSGLSRKLGVDSRICLDYLPGSFTVPVVGQVTVYSNGFCSLKYKCAKCAEKNVYNHIKVNES